LITLSIAAASPGAWAQNDSQPTQHQPNATTVEGKSAKDAQVKAASAEKMVNAKNPEEKTTLMAQAHEGQAGWHADDGIHDANDAGPDACDPVGGISGGARLAPHKDIGKELMRWRALRSMMPRRRSRDRARRQVSG
jgi:hypothetical protein